MYEKFGKKMAGDLSALPDSKTKTLVISATSAGKNDGDLAKITINNVPVKLKPNRNGNYKGLHLVTVNAQTGKIKSAQVFETSSSEFETFIENEGVPTGDIIVIACKDECVSNLSDIVKIWL